MAKSGVLIGSVVLVLIIVTALLFVRNSEESISSFEECVAAGYPVMESYPRQCSTDLGQHFVEDINDNPAVVSYFKDQLFERGIDNLGAIPIEGFTPDLYIGAFPGLMEEDFDGVEAINGIWVVESGNLNFKMDSAQLITSADGTVNDQGLATLLSNLEDRLGRQITTTGDVDALLDDLE